jgi:hypothetical protein
MSHVEPVLRDASALAGALERPEIVCPGPAVEGLDERVLSGAPDR